MLSSLFMMWYAAVSPAFGRVFGGLVLAGMVIAGESFGQYPEGLFVLLSLILFLYTDVLRSLLRASGARSLALYTVGALVLYVGFLGMGRIISGHDIHPLIIGVWLGELIIGSAMIQSIARPERILHERLERYAKVEEVFRFQ